MKSWEPSVLLALVVAMVGVPPIVRELYPFSLPSMFSAAPRQLAQYTVTDEQGRSIELIRVNLHVEEWHDPPVTTFGRHGYGRRIKPSTHVIGQVASAEAIEAALRKGWSEDPALPDTLTVRQEVYTQGARGALEQVADHQWRWTKGQGGGAAPVR